jgi:hypothetical protein
MSYIPPHLRNNKNVEKPVLKQDDFPALSVSKTKSQFIPKRSFATLANEWSEESEFQKQKEESRKEIELREVRRRESAIRNLVTFNSSNRTAGEYYQQETESIQQSSDDWTTVNHIKLKRELSDEARIERELAREEEEKRMKEEDSMWASNTHDDWDYRDRRST